MSDTIEISVNNPLNILDQTDSLSTDTDEESKSEYSGELSYDSDDETSESYIIFLEEVNIESQCYVCFDKTKYISPCRCKIPICNDCFIEVIINNGKNCTICRDRFEESIITDIKNNFSELSHSSAELTESIPINNRVRIRDRKFKFFICFAIMILILLTSPILGVTFKLIFHGYFFGEIFSFSNYLIGLIFWSNFIFLLIVIRLTYKCIKFLYEELEQLLYYYLFHR